MTELKQPWIPRQGENRAAREAFSCWLEQGPARSEEETAARCGATMAAVRRWRKRWQWDSRARAWDTEQQRLELEQAALDWAGMLRRHVQTGRQMQERALQALEGLDPAEMNLREIRDWIKAGVDLEQDGQQMLLEALNTGRSSAEAPVVIAGGDALAD